MKEHFEQGFRVPGTLGSHLPELDRIICHSTGVVEVLLDISVMRYTNFQRSERKEEGCSSKMKEHWERNVQQFSETPAKRSGGGKRGSREAGLGWKDALLSVWLLRGWEVTVVAR